MYMCAHIYIVRKIVSFENTLFELILKSLNTN